MRKFPFIVALGLVAVTSSVQSKPRLSGEERVAREVEGRVAGEPVACIHSTAVHSSRIIDNEASCSTHGSTIYVNRPARRRQSPTGGTLLVTRPSARCCAHRRPCGCTTPRRGWRPARSSGDFVPYRRQRPAR